MQEATLAWHKPWIFGRKLIKQALKGSPDALYKWETLYFRNYAGCNYYLMDYFEVCRKYKSYVLDLQTELLQKYCKEHIVLGEHQNG